jgi:diguanylate cyclase (GGDEF)-like protein
VYRWIACTGRTVLDSGGRVRRLVGSITDVTARRLLQEQLEQEALFDALTGLAKSTLFKDRLTEAIAVAEQRAGYRFAVLFIDLNGFKEVNDTFGHAVGDELLASVGQRLKESVRRTDTAARLGGDEFAILIGEVDQETDLPLITRRTASLISAPYQIGARTVTIGASIGVAVSDAGYPTADAMLNEADAAMYRAKRRSREHADGSRALVTTIGGLVGDVFPTRPTRHGFPAA